MMRTVLVVGLALSCADASRVSPVQKVIQLIDDMIGKVTKDVEVQASAFTESAKFCDDEIVTKQYSIKDAKAAIEELSSVVEDETAKISEFETQISDLSTKISEAEAELSKAVSLREKEHADFSASESEMVGTVESLAGAKSELEKALGGAASLAQVSSADKSVVDQVMSSLSTIVDASFFTHAQKARVSAFLQSHANDEDDLELSSASKKEGGSNAIIETLEEMSDKAEGTLSDLRKEEMEAGHAHAMLKQGMESQIASLKKEMGEATHSKQVSTETLAQAGKDLATEKKNLASDTEYSHDLTHDCMVQAQEWEVENRDGQAELTALNSAKAILVKKFAAFIQKSSASVKVTATSDGDNNKARALRLIQQVGRKFHSTALVALAYRASGDPFGKVRGMIEDMIAKLMQEAAEEASQKAFCDEEMGKSNASKDDKSNKIAKLDARIEKSESALAQLTEGVAVLSKELAEIDEAVAQASAIREQEKGEFMHAEKDYSESEEACAAALEVLREYYEGGALVQVSSKTKVQDVLTGDGSGIIGVLELAESDFAKLLADVRSAEEIASDEYNKMMQDTKLTKATKEMEVKGKQSEVKTLKTSLNDFNEDKSGISTELDAVLAYLAELKPQCETAVPTYAERKAAREQEIEGLKEALTILEA